MEIVLALTLYAEAGGESIDAKMAVASVIHNRAGGDPKKMAAVCEEPYQFSCWNHGSFERPAKDNRAWAECVGIASALASGKFVPTTSATHYHDTSIEQPYWAKGKTAILSEGKLRFYGGIA